MCVQAATRTFTDIGGSRGAEGKPGRSRPAGAAESARTIPPPILNEPANAQATTSSSNPCQLPAWQDYPALYDLTDYGGRCSSDAVAVRATAKRSICNSGTMLGSGFGTCLAECGFTVTC